MKPCAATASQEKSHFRNWSSKRYLSPLMRPTKCPDIPVSLERNTEVFRQHFLGAPSTLLISTGGSTPLLCLEGVPDLPVAPQDEAGLTTTFQRWPPWCFHISETCRIYIGWEHSVCGGYELRLLSFSRVGNFNHFSTSSKILDQENGYKDVKCLCVIDTQ